MENWQAGLKKVFSNRKYSCLFAAILLILAPTYAILTSVFLPGTITINPKLNIADAFFSMLAALLGALGLTVTAYQEFELHRLTTTSKIYVITGLAGLFISVSLIYRSAWLSSVGLGAIALLLVDFSIYVVIGSILFTLYTIGAALADAASRVHIGKKK
ncbi:Uncharacterised protein [uncultured archaeon]|nr:Uncharacterised protein [uncultured archaeon]